MASLNLGWGSNIQQDELRVVLKGQNHVCCLLACDYTIGRHPLAVHSEVSHLLGEEMFSVGSSSIRP